MASSDDNDLTIPKRGRRWPWVLGGFVILIAGGWFMVERYVQPERYRPMLVERIERATGLPVQVGEIDLTLLPVPSAHVRKVSVGDGDFRVVCEDVVVYPRLQSLGRGEFEISEVWLEGVVATLPADLAEARKRIVDFADAVSDRASDTGQERGARRFTVRSISAEEARVYLGTGTDHALECDITIDDVLSGTIAIRGEGYAPYLGGEARFEGDVAVMRTGDPDMGIDVQGNLALFDVDSTTLVKTRNIPSGAMNVEATFGRTGARSYYASLSGHAAPYPFDGVDVDALEGEFTAQAFWDSGTVTINDFLWQSDAIALRGDLSVPADGPLAAEIVQIQVDDVGLNSMFAYRPDLPIRLNAAAGGMLAGQDVLFGLTEEKYIRLVQGSARFEKLEVATASGDTAFANVSCNVTFDEGVIHVERVDADGISLTGEVRPDFSTGVTAIDVSGQMDLSRERLLSLVDLPQIAEASGRLDLTRVTATIVPGEGMPADLVVEGSVTNGVLAIETDAWSDRFASLSANFTAQPGEIRTVANATSQKLGTTSVDGRYVLDDREWQGTAQGDLSKMDLPFLKQESAREVAPGIVAAYGPSAFAIALQLPGPERPRAAVAFDREGAPELAGTVAWRKTGDAWALDDVLVDATIPGETLHPILPEGTTASGDVGIHFTRLASDSAFDAAIELTPTMLTFGDLIRKDAGVVAAVRVRGEASKTIWRGETISIECLGESVAGRFEDERFIIDPLDVNLATLAPLLARGGETRGRVTGRIATNPTELNLTLTECGAALSPDLTINTIEGSVQVGPDTVRLDNLAVAGANSNCVVTAQKAGGAWSGSVTGQQLDINGVTSFIEAIRAYRGESEETAATPSAQTEPEDPFNGSFSAKLNTLLYRQARFENASATVAVRNGQLIVSDLYLARDGGTIAGAFATDGGKPVGRFRTDLVVTNVPAQVIDELAFVEPRGLQGNLNGTVALDMPTGEGINPTHGFNGNIAFTGENGSFGKLGIATQILAVLRTTEITRLRMPALRDEGLTYDSCQARVSAVNGLMTIEAMEIRTPTYLITAQGTIDFPANDTELLVHVNLLEGVLSAGDLVPGVRELADQLRAAGGMRILVTGPPENPSTRYGFGPPIVGGVTDEVLNTLKSTTDIVREQIFDRAGDALRNILK
ncbi:MAG: hypothetical protein AMXMBFR82_47530 [Candidatus Hydrogenedentota bacterium]